MIADTSAIRLQSTSWVKWACFFCNSIPSRILRVTPIMRSHAPPMWDACGRLNSHVQPFSWRYFRRLVCFSFAGCMLVLDLLRWSWFLCLIWAVLLVLSQQKTFAEHWCNCSVHRLYDFYVYCSCTHTCEEYSPPFVFSYTASGAPSDHCPWTKNVQPHVRKWRRCTEALRRKICHLLNYLLSSESAACHTTVKDRVYQSFPPYNPQASSRIAPSVNCLPWWCTLECSNSPTV